jgi:hypothetical protein
MIVLTAFITGCAFDGGKGSIEDGPKVKHKLLYHEPGKEDTCTSCQDCNDNISFFSMYTFDVTKICTDPESIQGQVFGSPLRDFTILMYNTVFSTGKLAKNGDGTLNEDAYGIWPDTYGSSQYNFLPTEPVRMVKILLEATSKVLLLDYQEGTFEVTNDEAVEGEGGAVDFESILSVIKTTACAILLAVWSMGFITQIVQERFTMDTMLKTLMQLLMGIVLVLNGDKLVVAFAEIGTDLAKNIDPQMNLKAQFKAFADEIENCLKPIMGVCIGFDLLGLDVVVGTLFVDIGGNQIWALILMILPFLGQLLCAYKILSIMIMRMLELIVRITFAPIPIAFGAQSGFSQDAIRYFRGILACAAQPALIIVAAACVGPVITVVCQALDSSSSSTTVTGLVASIAIFLAYMCLNAFIAETKRLAQEIIGR